MIESTFSVPPGPYAASPCNGLSLENQVTLIHQVLEPFVQHHVAAPTFVEFVTMGANQPPKSGMAVVARQLHGFRELPVEVDPDTQVRIGNTDAALIKEIRQRQSDRITAALDDLEMQVSVAGDARSIIAVETVDIWNESLETEVI